MGEPRKSYLVIAVARCMGSGGSYIGKRLATRLGCAYMDRELLLEAAKRLHKDPEALEAFDERHLSFWERTRMGYAFGAVEAPYIPPAVASEDSELFQTQRQIILDAAAKGPLVVVGRAGFWILRQEPGLLAVYLHAPFEARAARVKRIYSLGSIEEARDMVAQSDRQREAFLGAVTGSSSQDPGRFHLCVDTFKMGTAVSAELIYDAAMEVARGLASPSAEAL